MICGSSTGALIALLLLQGVKICDLENKFKQILKDMYQPLSLFSSWLSTDPMQQRTNLMRTTLEKALGTTCLTDLVPQVNPFRPHILAVATDVTHDKPYAFVFQNYKTDTTVEQKKLSPGQTYLDSNPFTQTDICDESLHEIFINVAAAACVSTPALFKCMTISNRKFADGSIVANNPSFIAFSEASKIWPNRKINLILSLGCGIYLDKDVSKWMQSRVCIEEKVHTQVSESLKLLYQNTYMLDKHAPLLIRFNPPMSTDVSRPDILDESIWNKWKEDTLLYVTKQEDYFKKLIQQ